MRKTVVGWTLIVLCAAQSGIQAQPRVQPLGERLADAQAALRRGEALAVIDQLEALRLEFPDDPALQALLGRALVQNREFARAEPHLAEAIAGGHADFGTRLTLAAVSWENGRLDQAERLYREAVESSSDDPAALYPLAKLLLWRGDSNDAVTLLARVRASRPGWPEVSLDLARALEQSGRPADALEHISAFVAAAPEHAEALYTLATIYRQLGRDDLASATLERYRRAQAEDRENTLATGRREAALTEVRSHLSRGDGDAALDRLTELPEDPETLWLAARALETEGRAKDALRMLERAVAADPSRADIRVALQEAYRRLGEAE